MAGAVLLLGLGIAVPHSHAAEQLYTCGMHPQIIKKEPGNCPICGMALTPIRANTNSSSTSADERKVKFYKSSMKPGEISDKPGKDSMGMDLVPVYEDGSASAQTRVDLRSPPIIVRQPVDQIAVTNSTAVFTVAAMYAVIGVGAPS